MQHLDVAGGTGDVAFRVLQAMQVTTAQPALMRAFRSDGLHSATSKRPQLSVSNELGHLQRDQAQQEGTSASGAQIPLGHVHLCDINPGMLEEGFRKAQEKGQGT